MKRYGYGMVFTLLAATLTVSPAFSQEKGKGKERRENTQLGEAEKQTKDTGKEKHQKEKNQGKQSETKVTQLSDSNLGRTAGELPPGLEKYKQKHGGHLPPGLEKQLAEKGHLSPGLR